MSTMEANVENYYAMKRKKKMAYGKGFIAYGDCKAIWECEGGTRTERIEWQKGWQKAEAASRIIAEAAEDSCSSA